MQAARIMLIAMWAMAVSGAAVASPPEPNFYGHRLLVPSGAPDTAKEAANKALVMDWLHGFWTLSDFDQWRKWMAPDFVNHDPREPIVGAQALVDWLRARIAENKVKHPERPAPVHKDNDHFMLVAEGDLVILAGIPGVDSANYDPKLPVTNISGNIIRVKDGKIAEWWFFGSNNKEVDNYNHLKVLGLSMGMPGETPAPAAGQPKATDHPANY